jgi:hypothetical protein
VLGTAGIGKSLFLFSFLDHIVKTVAPIPSIDYVQREVAPKLGRYRLLGNGDVILYDEIKDGKPDYLLSDSCEIGSEEGGTFSLLIASEKEADSSIFRKRVRESGECGVTITMPPFTAKELLNIKPINMSDEEATFRGTVFGGSARNFIGTAITDTTPLKVVVDTMKLFFPSDYSERFSHSWQNIVTSISEQLGKMSATASGPFVENVMYSMFFHLTPESRIWASIFMRTLAAKIFDDREISVSGELRLILDSSGVGSMFENLCHLKLTRCVTQFSLTPLKPRYARANSDLISFNIETVILRVVADISSLPDKR